MFHKTMQAASALVVSAIVTRQALGRDRGASLVEYALLVALIALVCFAAVTTLGQTVSSTYTDVGSSLT